MRAIGYCLLGVGVLFVTAKLTVIAFINSESDIGGVVIGCLLMVIGAGLCRTEK